LGLNLSYYDGLAFADSDSILSDSDFDISILSKQSTIFSEIEFFEIPAVVLMGLMSFIYFFVRLKGYYFEGFVDS
jgi:hypothetical protein